MNKGQALVGWLLVMAAGMTLVLATAFRSVSNVKVSERDEASVRSFQAAQSALEKAVMEMPTTAISGVVGEGGFTYNYQAEMVTLTASSFVFPKEVMRDDTQTIWLVEHTVDRTDPSRPRLVADETLPFYEGGGVELYWSEVYPAAVEVSLVYEDADLSGERYFTERWVWDPFPLGTCLEGSILTPEEGSFAVEDPMSGENVNFLYHATVDFPAIDFGGGGFDEDDHYWVLRVRFLCNDQPESLGVRSEIGYLLPTQVRCFSAIAVGSGVEDASQGKESTKLEQCLFYPSIPGVFDYSIFSGEDISH